VLGQFRNTGARSIFSDRIEAGLRRESTMKSGEI